MSSPEVNALKTDGGGGYIHGKTQVRQLVSRTYENGEILSYWDGRIND